MSKSYENVVSEGFYNYKNVILSVSQWLFLLLSKLYETFCPNLVVCSLFSLYKYTPSSPNLPLKMFRMSKSYENVVSDATTIKSVMLSVSQWPVFIAFKIVQKTWHSFVVTV
jgi:hypothetical protein